MTAPKFSRGRELCHAKTGCEPARDYGAFGPLCKNCYEATRRALKLAPEQGREEI